MNNIVFKVTKKYMKLNRRRTAVTFIGIVFMVMLMTCVFVGRETVLGYMRKVASLDKGSWHVIAYNLTPDEAEQIADMDNVETLSYSQRLGELELPCTGDAVNKPFIEVKAFSPDSFELANITVSEGRLPENDHELLISKSAIDDGADIKIGDSISGEFFTRSVTGIYDGMTTFIPSLGEDVHYGETIEAPSSLPNYEDNDSFKVNKDYSGTTADYTVVGIMEKPFTEKSGACYSALTAFNGNGSGIVNVFMVLDLDKTRSVFEFRQSISSFANKEVYFDTNELLLAFSAKGDDSNITSVTVFIEIFFTVLIMAASIILIYNVFNMSFSERAKYLGMLSAVGATGRQKRQSIYYECFTLLAAALPAGILLGMGVIAGAMQLLKPQLDKLISTVKFGVSTDIPVTLSFGIGEIGLIIAMCVITVMISAFIPAVKISRVGTVESIRGNTEKAKKKHFRTKKDLLEKGRPEKLLAVNSTTRQKHLTKGIVRSISIFAVLAMVTLYGAQSVIKMLDIMSAVEGWTVVPGDYDYYIVSYSSVPERDKEIETLLSDDAVEDVKMISSIYMGPRIYSDYMSDEYKEAFKELFFQYRDNTEADYEEYIANEFSENISFIVVDDEEYRYLAEHGDADMDIVNDTAEPSVLVFNEMTMSTDYYRAGNELMGYKCIELDHVVNANTGDMIRLEGYNIEKDIPVDTDIKVAGFVDKEAVKDRFEIRAFSLYVFMNRSGFEKLHEDMECQSTNIYLLSTDKENDSALISEISDYCETTMNDPENGEVVISNISELDMTMSIKQVIAAIIRILAYSFTGLISVVCLLNLYNSIRGRAAERTRETAILRSMGMTDKQLTKMRDTENLMLLRKGFIIAAVVCTVLCLTINWFLTAHFGKMMLEFPILLVICIPVVIGLASTVITRLCYRSADKMSIVEEIRKETV